VNRTRIGRRHGVSELSDVIDLTDAAARALTLAQLATETLSVPQRAVLGASAGDFQDKDGKVLPVWEAYFGAVWALENPRRRSRSSPPPTSRTSRPSSITTRASSPP
jgi:hypothetical protein